MKFQLRRYEEVTSTNDIALEAARHGAGDGLVVWRNGKPVGEVKKTACGKANPAAR